MKPLVLTEAEYCALANMYPTPPAQPGRIMQHSPGKTLHAIPCRDEKSNETPPPAARCAGTDLQTLEAEFVQQSARGRFSWWARCPYRPGNVCYLSTPLDVLAVEGELFQQSNQLLATELQLNQSIADNQQRQQDIQFRLDTLAVELERNRELQAKGLAQRATLEDMQREQNYQRELLAIARAITAQNQQMRSEQLSELKGAEARLLERLSITTQLLDQLLVRAPIEGELIALDAKLGELKETGAQLGSMISAGERHITSQIDEFYSSQIEVGGAATLTVDGSEISLRISRIYPQVEAGKVKLELQFSGPAPEQLKINQSFPLRLTLGANSTGLWLSSGPYLNDSNVHWVYRLNADGRTAQRHEVRIGARNPQQVEIISGLSAGDQVIISSYRDLGDADRLIIE